MIKYSCKDIFQAIKKNDIEAVKSFLPDQLEAMDKYGKKPLHHACIDGCAEIARLLLDNGADIEVRDQYSWTPLHYVCFKGNIEIIQLLLDYNADIKAKDKNGDLPLHRACYNDKVEAVRLLLDRGADVTARNECGKTALHCIRKNSYIEVASLLLDYNADINACADDGCTLLYWTCMYGNYQLSEFLVRMGADPYIQNNLGKSVLDLNNEKITIKDNLGHDTTHAQILIQLRTEYLNKQANRQALEASERTAALSSGWEMEM